MHFFKTRQHFSGVCIPKWGIPKGHHTDLVLAAAQSYTWILSKNTQFLPIYAQSQNSLVQQFPLQQPTGYIGSEVYDPCLKRSIWPSYICAYIFTTGAQILCGIRISSPYIVPMTKYSHIIKTCLCLIFFYFYESSGSVQLLLPEAEGLVKECRFLKLKCG